MAKGLWLIAECLPKANAIKAANLTKNKHPIFSSITVIDGGKDWDYDYTSRRSKSEDGKKKAERDRKHSNQTCEDEVLERLQGEKDAICGSIPLPGCKPALDKLKAGKKLKGRSVKGITKNHVINRIKILQECIDQRQQIQDECFGGKPDQRHTDALNQMRNALENCQELLDNYGDYI
ncbi:hypothetical protein [Moorena sp. SIO3A5]|uniref:Novel toxin 16 domain-containing protein n=1 Tax=Moorena producens 3L TaxID=489825 RepID=F4XIU8_9CYAN|nr:hypothetical protein [Moorena sp. SIO3A5]EGJ35405.1 hypothetical protein LYNGBM3L_03780 [Moorena producens 3L]NES44964.1 hypothetical protein [Moorena sp. SIO2C4]OLT64900.1 hypothetical protein BI334_07530 [Moorena producens 3L]